ncbi:MAG TPA: DUF1189 family protein [Candidatus Limnocylindrales bacterium]|nr:DUF1189 family protein [Candidatus Limnocylindrales bacterium]
MDFFKKVQNSVYSPEFYKKIPKQSFGTALKYFLLLTLLFTVLRSIAPVWNFITVGQKEIEKFTKNAVNIYPSDLTINIKDGKVSTNATEPYFVPIPEDKTKSNLIVIDTKTPFSTTQFNQYKTVAWVTKDSIFVKGDEQGQLRTIDLSEAEDFTLNKTFVDSIVARISPWLMLIAPLAIAGIVFFVFLSNIFMLVSLLFIALLIWLLLKIIKKPLKYGESYKVGMYALTLGFFVDFLKEVLNLPGFPLMHTSLTLLVVLFNFISSSKPVKTKNK